MPGSFKTEAVVLRSIRYGEADRVLHLYTADRGRVGAVAKGVRRVKSRLGGRLEPLSRVRLVLHQGRGELATISQADTVHPHAALRERRASLERGTEACEAVLRLLDSGEANPPAYNLLCNELALLDADPGAATRAHALAFRLKLLLAAGFAPELASCAACGDAEHLAGFSPSAGGVVCAGCEAGSFPLDEDGHRFLVEALARPLAEAPEAPERALAQSERALTETLEYHAHVRLRRVTRVPA
jgi:DNA repair protein RecO (recombination protein O)